MEATSNPIENKPEQTTSTPVETPNQPETTAWDNTSFRESLTVGEKTYSFYNINKLDSEKVKLLPFTIRILLENSLRKWDGKVMQKSDIETILSWPKFEGSGSRPEIPFFPSRVLLQDYTGVPAVVDLASMRTKMAELDPSKTQSIGPQIPVDLVIDHSIQVDEFGTKNALKANEAREFERNAERFKMLKWAQQSFENFKIVPPGSGIVHQVNLENLARVVFETDDVLYPDTLIGTDSHTTMINGLGVLGWGVGGIEAEAVMLGENVTMLLPEVVGVHVTGVPAADVSATDVVLTLTNKLRKVGVVGKFVEYFGDGLKNLTLADRSTISNMAPEYGATASFFPIDHQTLKYLKMTGRSEQKVAAVEAYARANGLFRLDSENKSVQGQVYSKVVNLELDKVRPSVAGPKLPQDLVLISDLKTDFNNGLVPEGGFKKFAVKNPETLKKEIDCEGKFTLKNGSLLIAAITSCTNTSNPYALISAGLLARNAVEKGLIVPAYVKTSLSPGSKVVTQYLQNSGLSAPLNKLGFYLAGYGCMTCIGNSGDLEPLANKYVEQNLDMVFSSVLSGNRNYEGRVHPYLKANYLASPLYVVAYALAGTVNIDFKTEPVQNGIMLGDLLPKREEVLEMIDKYLTAKLFKEVYKDIEQGNEQWRALQMEKSLTYPWDSNSTYIKNPPYFDMLKPTDKDSSASEKSSTDSSEDDKTPEEKKVDSMIDTLKSVIKKPEKLFEYKKKLKLKCLLLLRDSITTDHISPAGKISRTSPASKYLQSHGVKPRDFNSYGSRRGNHEVMARGTFANVRIKNVLANGVEGPFTRVSEKSEELVSVYEGAEHHKFKKLLVIAGREYGSGSSRDWAAKGPQLQGVQAVIAVSYERIHRSNLIGMGILPLEFTNGQDAVSLKLTGWEKYKIYVKNLGVKSLVKVKTNTGIEFECLARIDTDVELQYLYSGGILVHVMKKFLANA